MKHRLRARHNNVGGERSGERGFAVMEVLLAGVLMIVVAFVALAVLQTYARTVADRATSENGPIGMTQSIARMRADAASSYAVYVPARDVFGGRNAANNGDTGHEVDFYARTDTGSETFWGYYWDATAHTLRRYDFDAHGHAGVANRTTGTIDPSAQYPALGNVRAFEARTLEANDLADTAAARSAYASIVAKLTGSGGATPQPEPVGFVKDAGPAPDLYGGNTTVQLKIVSDRATRTVHLASATMPSGFIVHLHPALRFIVYRINQVHRSWFGLAQKTHAEIDAQVLYNYSSVDAPENWKVWCDYKVYGAHINGLSLRDKALIAYRPDDYNETADGVYNAVTSGTAGTLDPAYGCGRTLPGRDATPAPVPTPTSPDVVDTPPPCFAQGKCWPPNAPPNWIPPSPWPLSSPPPDWCATHALSPVCSGRHAMSEFSRGRRLRA